MRSFFNNSEDNGTFFLQPHCVITLCISIESLLVFMLDIKWWSLKTIWFTKVTLHKWNQNICYQVISLTFSVESVDFLQKRLPEYANKFIEICLMITADHGPAVSGAHNTIVCARAGKDLISSLVSGLLTIVSLYILNFCVSCLKTNSYFCKLIETFF